MKNGFVAALCCVASLCLAPSAFAEPPAVKPGDSLHSILESYQGKRVTVRLIGGEEMTGKVRLVTKELLHLGELTGREYFDGVIDMTRVAAVVVRTRE